MLLHTLYLTLFISTFAAALPLEGASYPRNVAARAKTYAIVNVDGGTSTPPSPKPTTIVQDQTKTVEVTDRVTATLATASTTKSSSSATTPSPISTQSESPSVVTVIVTESRSASIEYYDDGLWKTSYAIKTFEAVTTGIA
jgi:hypothetical protein